MIARLSEEPIKDRDDGYKVTPVSMDMSFFPDTLTTAQVEVPEYRWEDGLPSVWFSQVR